MFKKNVWIVGLLTVLAIMIMGCVDALPPPDGVMTEVVNLQNTIKDAPVGIIEGEEGWKAIFKGTPFMKCGDPSFEIIEEGGVKKLKCFDMQHNWGEGLDIYDSGNVDVGAGFREGDKLYILGTVDPTKNGLKIANGNGQAKMGGWNSGAGVASFDYEYTLTANNMGEIKGADPKAIRLSYDGANEGRMGTIIFEQITVNGLRGGGTEDVYIDDFDISGYTWITGWADGLKIVPKKGKTKGNITIYYKKEGTTTWVTKIEDFQAVGTYDVKFTVDAAKGFNAASFDGFKMNVLAAMPNPVVDTTLSGVAMAGSGDNPVTPSDGKQNWCFLFNGIDAAKLASASPLAIRRFTNFTTPRYVYKFSTGWASYETITVTYDLMLCKLTGQSAAETEDTNIIVRFNSGVGYNQVGNDFGYPNLKEGVDQTWVIDDIPAFTAAGGDGFSFTKNHGGTGFLIRIKKVTYE
jgi:hypothetical protein